MPILHSVKKEKITSKSSQQIQLIEKKINPPLQSQATTGKTTLPVKQHKKDSTYASKPKINLLSLPLDSIYITSKFGKRTDPFSKKKKKIHHGIDLRTHSSEVYSIMPGKIKKIGYEKKGLGNYIKFLMVSLK